MRGEVDDLADGPVVHDRRAVGGERLLADDVREVLVLHGLDRGLRLLGVLGTEEVEVALRDQLAAGGGRDDGRGRGDRSRRPTGAMEAGAVFCAVLCALLSAVFCSSVAGVVLCAGCCAFVAGAGGVVEGRPCWWARCSPAPVAAARFPSGLSASASRCRSATAS
ncbi:hypothetical protein SBADM41S_11428 [Streptomyces badius]